MSFLDQIPMNNLCLTTHPNIMPLLWQFLDKHRRSYFSMNVATIDDELIVSIIHGKRIKRFKNTDGKNLIENLRAYLKLN